ncbi:hypothetical protein EDD16DRAFT_256076 [Pisolithus croceorrhizus]|nr:hypothetical protein EDD16DRAFT_256076 [Pisolithus croceorrhizus]
MRTGILRVMSLGISPTELASIQWLGPCHGQRDQVNRIVARASSIGLDAISEMSLPLNSQDKEPAERCRVYAFYYVSLSVVLSTTRALPASSEICSQSTMGVLSKVDRGHSWNTYHLRHVSMVKGMHRPLSFHLVYLEEGLPLGLELGLPLNFSRAPILSRACTPRCDCLSRSIYVHNFGKAKTFFLAHLFLLRDDRRLYIRRKLLTYLMRLKVSPNLGVSGFVVCLETHTV